MSIIITTPPLLPIIIIAITIAFFARLINLPKQEQKTKQYVSNTTYKRYTSHFSTKMEFDMRLPYKRFKQLYPPNNITYDEYKKLQTQSSFKHSISSQQNHRMVR